MTRISEMIFLGDQDDHLKAKKNGVEAILNVAMGLNYPPPSGVEYAHAPLADNETNERSAVLEAVDMLAEFINRGKVTLVHCHAGRSRSPCVVALYYNHYLGWTFNSALDALKTLRPIVDPNEGILFTAIMCSKEIQNG